MLRYQHYLDDSTLSDEDKQALLQALWNIMSGFVQLGFGIHPMQQAGSSRPACGKPKQDRRVDLPFLVHSEHENRGGKT